MSEHSFLTAWRQPGGAIERVWREVSAAQATLLAIGTLVAAVVLLGPRLDQGWWHHDDGSFAHSAERVLAGDLPNRDFADLYTGLLTFMNAAVFAIAGEDMFNLRLPLFILFLGFVACFYGIARRLLSPIWAFVATLFAIAWSAPMYPAPMPSWYTLFLTTIGIYTMVRYFETGRRRWLLAAGLCGGVSIAIKVVGVWYVAAISLALLVRPMLERTSARSTGLRSPAYAAIVTAAALAALGLAAVVFSGRPVISEVVGLLIPVAILCVSVVVLGMRGWTRVPSGVTGTVLSEQAVLIAGVGIPLAFLALPYLLSGSLGEFVNGVLSSPRSRYDFSSHSGPDPITLLRALPVVAVFLVRSQLPRRGRLMVDVAAGTVMVVAVATAATQPSYSILWGTTRALAPFVIVFGAFAILRRSKLDEGGPNAGVVALIVLVAGFSTLTQFPFAAPVYFCTSFHSCSSRRSQHCVT